MTHGTLGAVVAMAGTLLPAGAALAQATEIPAHDLSVTIYGNDLALIEDHRRIDVPKGLTEVDFPDVSAAIQPETVTLAVPDATIIEQNFDYDLLSPQRLLDKSVGQTIALVRTNPATGADTTQPARVLANNNGTLLQIGDHIEVLGQIGNGRLVYPGLPPGLKARPTLSVLLDSARGGTRDVRLSYLSHGFSWKADYVALFDPTGAADGSGKIDVEGWITLNNTTGTGFADARLTLVAGSVANSLGDADDQPPPRRFGRAAASMVSAGTEQDGQERVGDLHLYPVAGRTTLANAQQKQIAFMDVKGAPANKRYQWKNGWLATTDQPQSATSVLMFSTGGKDGLGGALPAGTFRVYARDARGAAQFIGEAPIGHTPRGSQLALPIGQAFDVKVQAALVSRNKIDAGEWEKSARWRVTDARGQVSTATVETAVTHWQTVMRYRVTNAGPTPATVEVSQQGLDNGWHDARVPTESLPGEQRGPDERVWQVMVPAGGETVLNVTFDTRN